MEEKLRREREEAIEEAKLAMERERMKMDFEREKEKTRRKEVRTCTASEYMIVLSVCWLDCDVFDTFLKCTQSLVEWRQLPPCA